MSRRPASFAVLALAVVTVVGAALSPLALAVAGESLDMDWVKLSNIGQAYGAASAIFSALALTGVTASLVYQARSVTQQQIQAVRGQQLEIYNMLSSDPETYGPAFMPETAALDPVSLRRHLFVLRHLHYLAFGYKTGLFVESGLRRESLPGIFGTVHGRRVWEDYGGHWTGHNYRRFARIVDEEYRKAVAAGPPTVLDEDPNAALDPTIPTSASTGSGVRTRDVITGGVVAALLCAGWLAGRRRN